MNTSVLNGATLDGPGMSPAEAAVPTFLSAAAARSAGWPDHPGSGAARPGWPAPGTASASRAGWPAAGAAGVTLM